MGEVKRRCINLRDWESRLLLALAAGETAVLVRPVALIDFRPSDTRGYDWSFRNRGACWNDVQTTLLVDKFSPFGRSGDTLIGREAWKLVTSPIGGSRGSRPREGSGRKAVRRVRSRRCVRSRPIG